MGGGVHLAVSSLLAIFLAAWPSPPHGVKAKLRVAIDAGHGAPGNDGNHGCYCQREQVHTLEVAQHLAFVLSALGPFEVTLLRRPGEEPQYRERLARAQAFGAQVVVSLHSDARGEASAWQHGDGGEVCYRSDDAPGFSVLWSGEGDRALQASRARLGRVVGRHLREAGFVAYSGEDYGDLYMHDTEELAGWVDARPQGKRVFFLYGSSIPTIIVETHHARDPSEVARWGELRTVDAFALAMAAALLEGRGAPLGRSGPPSD